MFSSFVRFSALLAAIGLPASSPSFAQDPLKTANEKLALAKKWSERVTSEPQSSVLIVEVKFFQEKLGDAKSGLFTRSKTPIADLQAFIKAIDAVTSATNAGKPWEEVVKTWSGESGRFLDSLAKIPGSEKAALAWTRFLRDWEHEALRTDPELFREALIQAGPIVTGLYLEYAPGHIAAAITTPGDESESNERQNQRSNPPQTKSLPDSEQSSLVDGAESQCRKRRGIFRR